MEKQRIKRYTKPCRRFLVSLLLLFCTSLLTAQKASQTLTFEQIKSLRIKPEEEQNLYTKTDIKFIVTIPNVRPAQVQVLSADQKQDITFRTMRKTENYDENGTSLELWFNFNKKGTYTLSPISVMIQNRTRSISFEPVTVTDDPATMLPRIVLVFDDGTTVYSDEGTYPSPLLSIKTGEKIGFTVNLQYAAQLMQFTWDIPKDSIFTCTKEFEFTEVKHRERVYSHDLIPVAAFEWTGLVAGTQSLPKIRLNAAGYNGYRTELILPEITIEFTEGTAAENKKSESDIFSAAFYQEAAQSEETEKIILSDEDCQKLAKLYSREHNLFLTYLNARKARIEFENEHHIITTRNPIFPTVLFYVSVIVVIFCIVAIIIALRKKHRIRTLIYTVLLLCGTAVIIYCGVRRSEKYGISLATKIYSIPQENAESSSEIASGTLVRILEKTGRWYYVEVGETGGWCNIENIYIIK